jgi:hypothetical protein
VGRLTAEYTSVAFDSISAGDISLEITPQAGSRFCFFHKNWQGQRIALNAQPASPLSFTMPVLEDADSVQVALMQVMRLILAGQLDPKIAGLLLYALQTASLNLRQMKVEPFHHESVVIDPRAVADNGVGDDAWSKEEFEEEGEDEEEEDGEEEDSEDEDEEDADEDDEEEDSSDAEQEDQPARPSRKPAHVARPSPTFRRQPGADKNAIVAELDENAIARHLLNSLVFGPRPPK